MKKLFLATITLTILSFSSVSFSQNNERKQDMYAISFDTIDQNALVEEIANQAGEDYLGRGYLIMRYDTLGALVLGLSGKQVGFTAPVEFISYDSEELSERQKRVFGNNIPKSGKVSDYNRIYPGLFVWIEEKEGKQTVILSIKRPEDIQILTLEEEKKEDKTEIKQEQPKQENAEPGSYFMF